MIKGKNFSNQIVPSEIDTEYLNCNFSHSNCITVLGQKVGHRIFPEDDTPRTFIDCNMKNCEPPPGSILMKANGVQKGFSVVEAMVIVSTEVVTIDGESIDVHQYADRKHGTYFQGVYSYLPTPVDFLRRAK